MQDDIKHYAEIEKEIQDLVRRIEECPYKQLGSSSFLIES